MEASFAEVLARETTALAAVVDAGDLTRWRRELIARAASPGSAYAKALRPAGDPRERAVFLDRWQDLIAAALARVAHADAGRCDEIDARRIAVSVLAALHGGSILSRVSMDSVPLHVSVELALAPLLSTDGERVEEEKKGRSVP